MTHTVIRTLIPALAAAALLAASPGTASAGTASAGPTRVSDNQLVLWTGRNLTGGSLSVPTGDQPGCFTVDTGFLASSADNSHDSFNVVLYDSDGCDGTQVGAVDAGATANLTGPVFVASVLFLES